MSVGQVFFDQKMSEAKKNFWTICSSIRSTLEHHLSNAELVVVFVGGFKTIFHAAF
jgi:hypothetical protein